jgi:uncharacterized damage-inducible protein DinB
MTPETVRALYDYHRWANRRLFDVAAALGEEAAAREAGTQFSFPTLKAMFAHLYGADFVWLERWRGTSPARLPGDVDFTDMAAVRRRWDNLETQQRRFIERVTAADLERSIGYTSTLLPDRPLRLPLWALLQHVPNHATHHRSEIATMLTMVSGSPPPTDLVVYHLVSSGQVAV